MSKAEERALEKHPILKTELGDVNYCPRKCFIEGYHQAEKDLKLTWEDIRDICSIQYIVLNEYNDYNEPPSNVLYQEVLKRFNESRKK